MKYRPFEATEIGPARLEGVFADCSYRRLAFTVGKPSLPATSTLKFDDQNPDRLTIDLGRRTEKGLNESSLAARSFAPEIIAVWKQLAKRLKAMTVAGAVAVDKATGATARLR